MPWGSLGPLVGPETRMAAGCVCHAALGGAASAGVSLPMYRVALIPADGVCVVEARRGEPRRDGYPYPWLAGCFSMTPELVLAREGDEAAPHHPLPKVPLGPTLLGLVSRGPHGVSDADLAPATSITALDVSGNPNITTVTPFARSLRKLTARGCECGIGDSASVASS